jgi:hypothetical protein
MESIAFIARAMLLTAFQTSGLHVLLGGIKSNSFPIAQKRIAGLFLSCLTSAKTSSCCFATATLSL